MVESGNLSAPDARPCVAASARRPRPAAHFAAGVVLALLSGLLTRIRISIATGAAVGICGDRWRTGFRARSPTAIEPAAVHPQRPSGTGEPKSHTLAADEHY
jgi:hypothetical protein